MLPRRMGQQAQARGEGAETPVEERSPPQESISREAPFLLMMILIYITLIVMTMTMAARRRRRRAVVRMVYLPFDVTIVLGTLVNDGSAASALQTLTQDFDIYGMRSTVTFSDVTAGEGPIEAGWAQAELTAAQIVENRNASPTSQWDVTANEQSKRKVRVFGRSSGDANDSLNDGKPIWRKMFLKIPSGKPLADLWVINRSGATLTTGQQVHFAGSVVGRWK